jgi:hypothetical protein
MLERRAGCFHALIAPQRIDFIPAFLRAGNRVRSGYYIQSSPDYADILPL